MVEKKRKKPPTEKCFISGKWEGHPTPLLTTEEKSLHTSTIPKNIPSRKEKGGEKGGLLF